MLWAERLCCSQVTAYINPSVFDFLHIYFSFLFPLLPPSFFAPICLSLVKSWIIENEHQGFLCGTVTSNLEAMSSPETVVNLCSNTLSLPLYIIFSVPAILQLTDLQKRFCTRHLFSVMEICWKHFWHNLTDTSWLQRGYSWYMFKLHCRCQDVAACEMMMYEKNAFFMPFNPLIFYFYSSRQHKEGTAHCPEMSMLLLNSWKA